MKLIITILIVTCLQANAEVFSQKITLSEKNVSLEKIFSTIKRQSGYVFFYNYNLLKDTQKISVDVKEASIKDALEACLKDQDLDYSIENKTVVITKKQERMRALSLLPISITITGKVTTQDGKPPFWSNRFYKGKKTKQR